MRVLQLKGATGRGGAETLVREFTRRAVDDGHGVHTVFGEEGWLCDEFARAALPFTVVPLVKARDLKNVFRVMAVFRDVRPEVVLAHGARVNLAGALAGRAFGVPSVSVEHNVDDWRKGGLRALVDRFTARSNAARIAVSRAVADMLRRQRVIDERKIILVPNGIALPPEVAPADARRVVQERFGISGGAIAGVTVARFSEQKGHEYLLRALAQCADRDFVWVFMGDGILRPRLEALASSLGVGERVRFPGVVAEVSSLLPGFDVFALPSLWEGMPVALLEAMAGRLACVATDVAGVPEVITNDVNGVLVPPRSPDELARALRTLMSSAPLRLRLGQAARETVLREFSFEKLYGAWMKVLGDAALLRRSGRRG